MFDGKKGLDAEIEEEDTTGFASSLDDFDWSLNWLINSSFVVVVNSFIW